MSHPRHSLNAVLMACTAPTRVPLPLRRSARGFVRVLTALTLALALSACGSPATPESAGSSSGQPPTDTLSHEDIKDLGMTVAEKQEALPPEFPAQIPVMAGEVSAARTAGGVVFYTLQVDSSASATSEWYRRTYTIANWTIVREREVEGAEGQTRVLEFEKGDGAHSDIMVRSAEESGSVVEGTVSVGPTSSDV